MIGGLPQEQANVLVRRSVEVGSTLIDTADVYSKGGSERTVGQSLRNLGLQRKDLVLATKVYNRMGPVATTWVLHAKHIMDAVDASLQRLQTNYIDVYQVHANDTVTPLEETLQSLNALVAQGKVRYVDVSNWPAWKVTKALTICWSKNWAPTKTVQDYYSLAGRDLERGSIPLLESEGAGLLVWSPLAGGLLPGKFSRENQQPACSRRFRSEARWTEAIASVPPASLGSG